MNNDGCKADKGTSSMKGTPTPTVLTTVLYTVLTTVL